MAASDAEPHPAEVASIDHIGGEEEGEPSPEAAGAVRGLSRTARAVAKRSAVGRIPKEAAKASSKAAAKTGAGATARAGRAVARRGGVGHPAPSSSARSVARTAARRSRAAHGGGRVPLKRVARTTDRISTGLDAVSTVVEQEDVPSARKRWDWVETGRKVTGWVGTLLKNTILGAAVFGTYELGIEKLVSLEDWPGIQAGGDVFSRVAVWGHFAVGALAGCTHAILSVMADSTISCARNSSLAHLKSAVSASSLPRSILHHSIAHSVLFGSYEMSKRSLLQAVHAYNRQRDESRVVLVANNIIDQQEQDEVPDESHLKRKRDELDWDENGEASVRYSHLFAIGAAGGIAGSAQHVISHYTERWMGIAEETEPSKPSTANVLTQKRKISATPAMEKQKKDTKVLLARIRWFHSLPALRPTALAFVPSAIGFMAFEYGKDFIA